jgi:hypothetical protein
MRMGAEKEEESRQRRNSESGQASTANTEARKPGERRRHREAEPTEEPVGRAEVRPTTEGPV